MLFFIFARRRGYLRRLIYHLCLFDQVRKTTNKNKSLLFKTFFFSSKVERKKEIELQSNLPRFSSRSSSPSPFSPTFHFLSSSASFSSFSLDKGKEREGKEQEQEEEQEEQEQQEQEQDQQQPTEEELDPKMRDLYHKYPIARSLCALLWFWGEYYKVLSLFFSLSFPSFFHFFIFSFSLLLFPFLSLFHLRRVTQKIICLCNTLHGSHLMSGLIHTWKCLLWKFFYHFFSPFFKNSFYFYILDLFIFFFKGFI